MSFNNSTRKQEKEIKRLQDLLFAYGAMDNPPCFCCGYNGAGYYQPDVHPCAARYHKLTPKYIERLKR